MTALHYSARNGHLSVVEYLVNHKANVNEINDWVLYFGCMRLLFI